MAKKKASAPKQQFIAIDNYRDEVVCIGTLDEVTEAIEEYINYEDYTQDEAEVNVILYELGEQKTYSVYPGKLEIVIED